MRNPKRTAATASALMVCVAVVGLMNIMASSTRASINAIVDRSFTGDFVVDPGGGGMGGVDHSLTERLAKLPQVSDVASVRVTSAKVDGKVETVIGTDPAAATAIIDVKPLQGSINDLGTGAIAVYEQVAKDKGLKVGDTVPVVFKDTGEQQLRIALIYGENRPAGNWFLGMPAYEANVTNRLDYGVYVKKAPNVPTATALAAVTTIAKDYPGVSVMDQSQFKASMAKPFNQMLGMVYVLLVLAVVIALLGIANTLALSVFERTRELGLLRAVGMTRSQLRSTIRWESVVIALIGTVLGLAVGVFFGWALWQALDTSMGVTEFSLPYRTLAVIVISGGLAGVLAAVLPSRRAAKLDILRAVVTD